MARTIALVVGLLLSSAGALPAKVLDLTSGGSGSVDGALFFTTGQHPTGAGFIDPFVRIQHNGVERGNNVDGPSQVDGTDHTSQSSTHSNGTPDSLLVSLDGADYREFVLDVNEKKSKGKSLSLDDIEVFLSGKGNNPGSPNLGKEVLDWGAGPDGNSKVDLSFALNLGTSWGDLYVYVPSTLYNATEKLDYLHSPNGNQNQGDSDFEGQFEGEWGNNRPPPSGGGVPPVPEPATVFLLGVGLALAGLIRKRR